MSLNRRAFVTGLGAALSMPIVARAQQARKLPVVGFLSPGSFAEPRTSSYVEAFRHGLRELGYVEGSNIVIEFRSAENKYERLPSLAAELVSLNVNVIVVSTVPAASAVKSATKTIPIVMAAIVDPVATGLVTNLARPGGNLTGLSMMAPELAGKQLELLKEIVPKASRVAVLWNPTNAGNIPQEQTAREAARGLGVRLQPFEARSPGVIDVAFQAMTRERSEGLIVLMDLMLGTHGKRIAEVAAKHRLPAVYGQFDLEKTGGLIAYGVDLPPLFRRSATYVDKILRARNPVSFPSSSRRNSSSWSTSRPPRRSASRSRRLCCCGPIR